MQPINEENTKMDKLRETSIIKTKKSNKLNGKVTEQEIKSFSKLPFLKERKYSSTKNLIVSNTCEVTSFPEDLRSSYLNKIKRKAFLKNQESKQLELNQLKYFFQKRKNVIHPLELGKLKKYSSCNKLASFPNIPEVLIHNDQSLTHNENLEPQRKIKSTNSIKLQTIQYLKRPKLERIPMKRILKSQMSKTINPRKISSQNSIQLQNQQKNAIVRKKTKLGKDIFERMESKTKILVKNPFNKLPKKHSQKHETCEGFQPIRNLEEQFKLSRIFQDTNDESEISVNGKQDLQDLIGHMNQ